MELLKTLFFSQSLLLFDYLTTMLSLVDCSLPCTFKEFKPSSTKKYSFLTYFLKNVTLLLKEFFLLLILSYGYK